MEFPEQSIRQAREIAEKYARRTKSKLEKAANLYDGYFFHIQYGFDEPVKEGNCGRFLHEIKKSTDCFTQAGVLYLIAREAGLKPRIWSAIEMKDVEEGERLEDEAPSTHTFISVVVGNQRGKEKIYLVDPLMHLFGVAKVDDKNHVMKVYNKHWRKVAYRHYGSLFEFTEQDYLAKVQELRNPGGGRVALSSTKTVSAAGKNRIYLTFLPQTSELKSSLNLEVAKFDEDDFRKYLVIDLVTPVSDKGDFDFSKGRFLFYYASAIGFDRHENPGTPIVFPTSSALDLFQIWNAIARESGRKSPDAGRSPIKLEDMLRKSGFF